MNKKWIFQSARVAFGFFLLGLLFWITDISELQKIIRGANLPLFLITFFSYIFIQLIFSYRWHLLLKVFQLIIPIMHLFKTYLIGLFFTNFLPTAIGGDVVRGFYLYRFTKKGKEVAISVIVERFTGFTAQTIIALGALGLIYSSLPDSRIAWIILGTTFIYLLSVIIFFNKKVFIFFEWLLLKLKMDRFGQKTLEIYDAISLYKSSQKVLLHAVLISLLVQVITIILYYILSLSLHLSIPLFYFFLFLPIINIVSMVPITPGGLGLREGTTVALFKTIGNDENERKP